MGESEWTIGTLKEHFEDILEEKDKAINIALAAAKEAVQAAEANAEKWRSNANEWRGAMTDREKNFATKDELLAFKESSEKAAAVQKERSDVGQGHGSGLREGWGYLVGAVGLAIAIYSMLKR
jgi:hypothetical protein